MGITRKEFLSYSTISGLGLIGLMNGLPLMGAFKKAEKGGASVSKWMTSVCQGCTTWCPVEVNVVGNRAIKIKGSDYSLANHGKACVRSHMAIQQVYDPDRIKVPMKRTNPIKGRDEDPKFVPISWDEAIDTITDKMMALREANETHKFVVFRGRYTYMRDIIYEVMPKVFGSPNGISHSAICAEAEKFGAYFTEGYWGYRDYDLDKTRYVICWGADPVASNRQVPHATSIWGKVRKQAKIAAVDPRLSTTAAKADEWLPVIPGEDGALAVAIAHTILVNGMWSKEFVGDFIDGVNLFVPGKEVDESQFKENYSYGLIKWWNLELKDRTPLWAEKQCGIPAKQIERVAKGFADAAPRAISWVSPGTAMQVRGGYGALAAHALNGLVGSVDNEGGTVRGSKIPVNKVPDYKPFYDEIAKAGTKHKKMDQRGYMKFPALKKGKPGGGVVTNNAADAIIAEDPYKIKVAIGYWNNFAFSCSGTDRWEKALTKLPFFAHITTHASEMSHFADIVLPACHQMFEKYGFVKSKQNLIAYAALNKRILKPIWDTKMDETEIPWLIAESLKKKGFSNLFDCLQTMYKDPETGKIPEDSLEFSLSALKYYTNPLWDKNHKNYGKYGDAPDGWNDFYEKGVWNSKKYGYRQQWGKFKTSTKKFEFYSETLKKSLGKHADKHHTTINNILKSCDYTAEDEQAFIPHYEPAFRRGDPTKYPFVFFEHRSRLNREGRSANITWYLAHKDADPGDELWDDVLKINPIDAKRLAFKNGDTVIVKSPSGELTCHIKIWEGVRPGTVAKCYGQGHWAYGRVAVKNINTREPLGGSNNAILPADYDRLSGSTARHGGVTRVNIVKVV
mgnify:CR=1 FL=1